ncbi:MAG: hypothetical protein ABIA63_00195, partial [bacterium]
LYTYPATAGGDGTITDIAGYLKSVTADNPKIHWVIYDASNRVDYSTEWEEALPSSYAKYESVAQVGATISAQTYYLGFHADGRFDWIAAYDAGTNPRYKSSAYSYPPPATWSPTTSGTDRKFTIYATYTPSGGGAAAEPTPQIIIIESD